VGHVSRALLACFSLPASTTSTTPLSLWPTPFSLSLVMRFCVLLTACRCNWFTWLNYQRGFEFASAGTFLLFQYFIVSGPKSATAGRFGQAADSHNIWPLCGRRPVLSQCPNWEASSITQLLPWIPMVYVYSSLAGVQLHHSWQMKHELKLDWAKLTRSLAYFAAHCQKIFREHQEQFLKQVPS